MGDRAHRTAHGGAPESCIYDGEVMHSRLRPMRHRFVYRVFSLLLDLDEAPSLARRLRLFGHNRPALFALYDRDHGARDGSPLRPWVERQLAAHGVDLAGGRVYLHCLPRLLGYVFNPLSVYWCYDAAGILAAMIYEVKNTFGGQHAYVIPVRGAYSRETPLRQRAAKAFYVSPFIEMDVEYRFRVSEPGENLAVLIREGGAEGDILVATHNGDRRKLTDAGLLRAFCIYPFVTLKIIVGIHWEALRLWLKGARLQPRPPLQGREGAAERTAAPREATP